ncbi:type I phosphomannose isomerase catalytic subunit [Alistipes finegoldii]|uniref:type I phosphomannose isomerase catalytic subunit n=1 Tax=Alistipes finegoldii TaxID=214856 RepID=UPI003AF433DC
MKPFRFTPILKSLIWGGDKIAPYKGIETTQTNIGESWELSGVAGDESVVAEGEYAGYTLPQLIAELKERLVGKSVYERFGTEFPLLVKFIDARADLSIQVHPDDALAQMRHGKHGKTEMWYVVGADRGAHLKAGFSQKITPEEYERRVADNTLTDVLCDYAVQPGDLFFLPAGRVHAICAGSFVAEIQQTSDVTYRIYDYGRLGKDGKPRELHTELAKDAIDYTVLPDYRSHYVPAENSETELVACPYFVTSLYDLDAPAEKELSQLDSFLVVMCLAGRGTLVDDEGSETPIRQGETLLVPASTRSIRFVPEGAMKILTSRL